MIPATLFSGDSHPLRPHRGVDTLPRVNSFNNTLTRRFRALQNLLEQDGRFVLIEDLIGVSGALFRIYWPAELAPRPADAPGAASVCSGEPLARAAAAFQYSLLGQSQGRDDALSITPLHGSATLEDRIVYFLDSLREACRLNREGEYSEGERYLSGRGAYEAIIREVEREGAGPGRCGEELQAMFPEIGGSRIMLGRYLDRLGNFIGTGPAIESFEREGEDLFEAGRMLENGNAWTGNNRRAMVKKLRSAYKNYSRGFRVIYSVLEEEKSR